MKSVLWICYSIFLKKIWSCCRKPWSRHCFFENYENEVTQICRRDCTRVSQPDSSPGWHSCENRSPTGISLMDTSPRYISPTRQSPSQPLPWRSSSDRKFLNYDISPTRHYPKHIFPRPLWVFFHLLIILYFSQISVVL